MSPLKSRRTSRPVRLLLVAAGLSLAVGVQVCGAASAIGGAVEMCQQLGPGTWEINGVTYTCS